MPVTSARRADSAGIDSGIARSKRSDFLVSSFRFGVFGGRAALERVHVVGADERQHHEERAAPAVVPELGGGGPSGRERAEHARSGGARAAPSQQAPARERHPPSTALPPFRLNCGSVPPASSSRMRQYLSTSSGCWSATSTSSSGSFRLS